MQPKSNNQILERLYRHWRICFVTGILGLYGLGSLTALWSGTYGYGPGVSCRVPFLKDYLFHIDLLIVFPVAVLLLPRYFKNANHCLLIHLNDTALPYKRGKGLSPLFRKWLCGMILFAASLIAIITALNIRSLTASPDVELKTWFTPSAKTLPATMFYFSEIAVASLAAAVIIAYHCTVMMELRKIAVPDKISDFTWSIAPGGPIDATLSSLLSVICVLSFLPVGVILGRTYNMGFSLFDLVTMLNMTVIPLIILLIIVLPYSLSGIPKCLRTARQKLLDNNAKKIGELWEELSHDGIGDQKKTELVEEIDHLEKNGGLIKSRYPVFPLTVHAKKIASAASALPVVVSLVTGILSALESWIAVFYKK